MLTLYKLHILYHLKDIPLGISSFKGFAIPLAGLLEQQDPLLEHQEIDEQSLFLAEQIAIFIFQLNHLAHLLMIILDGVILSSSVNHYTASIFDVFESFKAFMQVSYQLWQLISSGLTDMTLIDY